MHALTSVALFFLPRRDGRRPLDLFFLLPLPTSIGANEGPAHTSSLSGVVGPGYHSLMCVGSKTELLMAPKESGSSLIWMVVFF
jgi:hypothetical protein